VASSAQLIMRFIGAVNYWLYLFTFLSSSQGDISTIPIMRLDVHAAPFDDGEDLFIH
jgi:hypothetical protein